MAIDTYADYQSKLKAPRSKIAASKSTVTSAQGRLYSTWISTPYNGTTPSVPTTATALSRTSAGCWGQFDSAGVQRIAQVILSSAGQGTFIIADRLSHQAGLGANVSTAQTTNLPTAALTRYTSGVGVWAGLEIYSQIGASITTYTANYKNQNNDDKTTPLSFIGSTGYREQSRILLFPLDQGDTGVRQVSSVTLTGITGTAGNFGVTLFKPLMFIPVGRINTPQDLNGLIGLGGQLPEVVNDACLFWTFVSNSSGLAASVHVIED